MPDTASSTDSSSAQLLSPRPPMRLLRLEEVLERVPVSSATIYAAMKEGRFPRPKLAFHGVVAWLETDIEAWIQALPEKPDVDEDPAKRRRGRPRGAVNKSAPAAKKVVPKRKRARG